MQNAEIVDVGSLTPSMGDHIASMQNLKALSMFLCHQSLLSMYPLRDIANLQHLKVVDHTLGEALAHEDVVLSILFNSASTIRSLFLETSSLQLGNFLLGWEEMVSKADWIDQESVYLSALKSLSLIGLRFNQSLIDSMANIIDFMKLDDLTIGIVATGALRLFPFLRRLAAKPGTAKNLRKLSLVMSSERALHHLGDFGADMEFKVKIRFIASFDSLTSLELKEQNPYPVTIDDGTLLVDALWRAIISHGNLESLSINCTEDVGTNAIPRLSAATVTTLINNLPKLRNFEFAPAEAEIEEIGQALSRGKALVSILCCPQPNQPHASTRGPDSGLIVVTEILKGFLSRDFGNVEGKFVWEDHYKLKRISLKYRLWDVASAFGKPRKALSKKRKMAKQTSIETNERAAAWIPWLTWLLEHPETVTPEVNGTKSPPTTKEGDEGECADDNTVDWVYVDPYDAECGTLPRECMDPDFLIWVDSEGRHLMEDDPEAIKGVTGALRGLDRDRAAAVRELIQERWKKVAAVYKEQAQEARNKPEKTEEEPFKHVTQDKWTSKNLIFPKLYF
ncbi:hypothetical protein NCS55_01373300 [Fusarium keratoplasticum]|nr:hypothetical protein NCS55_01373300 [Fusarium keratoplasticum]